MEDTIKQLFTLDKKDTGYSIQIVVWDNTVNEVWDDEFVFDTTDLVDERTAKRITRRLDRFMDTYKKTPSKGKVTKKRSHKKDDPI